MSRIGKGKLTQSQLAVVPEAPTTDKDTLALLFQALPDAVCMSDRSGIIRDMNPRAAGLFGLTREKLIGQPLSRLVIDLLPVPTTIIGYAQQTGHWQGQLTVSLAQQGSQQCEVQVTPMADDRHFCWLYRPITGTVATGPSSASLPTIEHDWQQFEMLLDVLPIGVSIYEADGTLVFTNKVGRAITRRSVLANESSEHRQSRYRMRSANGQPMSEEDSPSGRARRGETFHEYLCQIENGDGSVTWLNTSGSPLAIDPLAPQGIHHRALVAYQDVTERQTLNQMIRTQHEMNEGIIEAAPFGIAVYDVDDEFTCLRHNTPYLRLLPDAVQERESIVGTPLRDLFDIESGNRTAAIFEQVRSTGKAVLIPEYPAILPPDTRVRWYRWTLAPIHGNDGTITALISNAIEITDQVIARQQAEQDANRLNVVLDTIPVGVVITGKNGQIIQVNRKFRDIWEGAPMSPNMAAYGEYRGWWPDGRIIAAEDWTLARVLTQGITVLDEEIDIETFAGRRKTVYVAATPILEDGVIAGAVAILHDITERRQLDRERQQMEQRTHETLDALIELATEIVNTLSISSLPHIAERITELTCQLFSCKHASLVFLDEADGETWQPLAVTGMTGPDEQDWWEQIRGFVTRTALDGMSLALVNTTTLMPIDPDHLSPLWERATAQGKAHLLIPLRTSENDIIGILHILPEQGQRFGPAEYQLALGLGQMATLFIQRDALMRERDEGRARVLALEETNQRMNRFLGIASHELRTPVTSIKTSLQLGGRRMRQLLAKPPASNEELQKLIQPIEQIFARADDSVNRLNRLVQDLLDATRIGADHLDLRIRATHMDDLTRETVQEMRLVWPSRTFELDLAPDGSEIEIDGDRISQVMANFLTNAAKYSPESQPIHVQLTYRERQVRFAVIDHGPGLAPDQQAHVFDQFYRAPGIEPLQGAGVGLGLGLFICRTIIERHGGAIGVESTPGHGATFWFTLPYEMNTQRERLNGVTSETI